MYTYGVSMVDNGYSMLFIYRFKKKHKQQRGNTKKKYGDSGLFKYGRALPKTPGLMWQATGMWLDSWEC